MPAAATAGPAFGSGAADWWAAVAAVAVLLVAIAAGVVGWQRWRRHREARNVVTRLRQACDDMLIDVLLPDPELGQIHLGFVLFNRQGVTVVDIREARGHIFGSESMQEWTVLSASRRYTFPNPLPGLHDRVAAIRRLLPDMPVSGYVAFRHGADFSKGRPPHVTMIDELVAEIGCRTAATDDMGTRQLLHPLWERLKRQVGQWPPG